MAEVIVFTLQDKLSGIPIQWMISLFKLGVNRQLLPLDGYSMPLVCKGGLMYLELQGIPADKDLQTYPSVHLTSPHEWDPSILDYEHPEDNGEPDWAINPNDRFQFDPNFDEFGDYVNRSLHILDIQDKTPQISPTHNLLVNNMYFNEHQLIVTN